MTTIGRRDTPHATKFLAVSAALVGFAIGALAVAGVILARGSRSSSGEAWSSWAPQDGGVAGEREIAAAVSPLYRAAPAVQLAVDTVRNDASATGGASGQQVAVRDPGTGSLGGLGGTTAVYNLCGFGPSCAISTGTPSAARLLLLRREALELALYTFHYIGGVDNVLAVLPPSHATTTASLTPTPSSKPVNSTTTLDMAVLFQRSALGHYLKQPLRDTLPEQLPPTVTEMPQAPEAELVSVITSQTLFRQSTVQSQDGSNVLVLDPLPPQ
jgi:hypothetical protein